MTNSGTAARACLATEAGSAGGVEPTSEAADWLWACWKKESGNAGGKAGEEAAGQDAECIVASVGTAGACGACLLAGAGFAWKAGASDRQTGIAMAPGYGVSVPV